MGMKTTQDVGNCGDEDHCQYHLGIDHCHTGNHCQDSIKLTIGNVITIVLFTYRAEG